jgi:hypothetical protein
MASANQSVGNSFGFPAILDRFPDALPILYYRRAPQTDGTYSASSAGSQTIVDTAKTPIPPTRPYNINENTEYTTATALKASTGLVFNQTLAQLGGASAAQELASMIYNTATGNAQGGYVLISAGPDRFYGTYPATATTRDDIVIVGGQ